MKKYLVIDSGGTKTAAILYGEDLKRIGAYVTGSLRSNTTPDALYEKHAEELISALGLRGGEIETVCGTFEDRAVSLFRSYCKVNGSRRDGEMELGLSAAGIFGDGVLALCGTGATAFARVNGQRLVFGGYGAAVSDEGSGYYIGRQALTAAIRDHEGRGPETLLTDVLADYLAGLTRNDFRQAVYTVYADNGRSPVASVARCVPAVINAAEQGDGTAKEILEDAGKITGSLVTALIKKYGLPHGIPVAVSGSVWRANPLFYNGFVSVYGKDPIIPLIEPVAGAVAKAIYEKTGKFDDEDAKFIASQYPEFQYSIDKPKKA